MGAYPKYLIVRCESVAVQIFYEPCEIQRLGIFLAIECTQPATGSKAVSPREHRASRFASILN
jgi:hypothetical protein